MIYPNESIENEKLAVNLFNNLNLITLFKN